MRATRAIVPPSPGAGNCPSCLCLQRRPRQQTPGPDRSARSCQWHLQSNGPPLLPRRHPSGSPAKLCSSHPSCRSGSLGHRRRCRWRQSPCHRPRPRYPRARARPPPPRRRRRSLSSRPAHHTAAVSTMCKPIWTRCSKRPTERRQGQLQPKAEAGQCPPTPRTQPWRLERPPFAAAFPRAKLAGGSIRHRSRHRGTARVA
mmetsp:Transcript_167007/g.536228  ORF Transcript_167007/g.536228 Transcript_167007/m.536228 type:complete len:201 (-) Transcript_167007:3-605(-)